MRRAGPLVSCIIPTKNRPGPVQVAIESVLRQSYTNIEIVVVDDSTNDETGLLVSSFDSKIRYIKNEESRGAPYSRNVGLLEARGDVITFLDDDDLWLPEKTTEQLGLLQRYPLVTCNFTTRIGGRKYFIGYPRVVGYDDLLTFNALGSCSFVMIDGETARGCYFDENLKAGQDWDYWLTVMKEKGVDRAGNAGKYLVEYNSSDSSRISTTTDVLSQVMELYGKRTAEYSPEATKMMLLYNAFPVDRSIASWMFREWTKAKKKGKGGSFFVLKLLLKRVLGRLEYF